MLVRRIRKEDLDAIAKLYKLYWNENSNINKMEKKLNQIINHPQYILLCAEINNTVVGTVSGIICEDLYGNCQPFLVMENMVTDKAYRKKGIGKALLNELEKIGKERECTQILFITDAAREDAISFYEAMGYNSKSHIGFKKTLK